jgi:hypothetical protein
VVSTASSNKRPLYSPRQIAIGSFLGGPVAGFLALWSNFRILYNFHAASVTLFWGGVFNVALFALLASLPERFPLEALIGIPVVYSFIAGRIAHELQASKPTIAGSDDYRFRSNWRVVYLAIVSWIAWVAVFVPAYVGLDAIGAFRRMGA